MGPQVTGLICLVPGDTIQWSHPVAQGRSDGLPTDGIVLLAFLMPPLATHCPSLSLCLILHRTLVQPSLAAPLEPPILKVGSGERGRELRAHLPSLSSSRDEQDQKVPVTCLASQHSPGGQCLCRMHRCLHVGGHRHRSHFSLWPWAWPAL